MEEERRPPEILLLTAEQDLDAEEMAIKEELVEEVMQELYREIHPKTPSYSATASLTAESCGASVSDSASTVMAGIKSVEPAVNMKYNGEVGGGDDCDGGEKKVGSMEGCDGERGEEGDEEEWLERVLSWGPVEVDPIPGF